MKEKRSSSDIITTLPQGIIETILCLLPIEEAARTSVLAKEWRYKWTKIPKLEFRETEVVWSVQMSSEVYAKRKKKKRRKFLHAIYQVLLLRQGPIHEFTISMEADESCFEIDQIILHLSMNHPLKKLTFDFDEPSSYTYDLPLSIFSLHHLTDLYLKWCHSAFIPTFRGLGSLASLTLTNVEISVDDLQHLLANCPSLKSLSLIFERHVCLSDYGCIMELFKCIPVIEELTFSSYVIGDLALSPVPKQLPSLIHLKYVCIEELGFGDDHGLTLLGILMKCSPNLEEIKLEINIDDDYKTENEDEYSGILKDYSDVWLEHLAELEIVYFRDYNLEFVFLEFILARSPNLKKVTLRYCDNWMKVLNTLLRAPRASQVVEFFN